VFVAWNGETCNLKWLWKMTQALRSQLSLPNAFMYFIDSLHVTRNYKGCKLHLSKSKLWKHLNDGQILNGAHDSLVDIKAQSDVLIHPSCVPKLKLA